MPANQARADLRDKLVLERKFIRKLNAFNRRMAKAIFKEYARTGIVLTAEVFQSELELMLFDHYNDVAKVFDHRISDTLPKDIPETTEERGVIDNALNLFFIVHSGEQAIIITKTNQADIADSLQEALEQEDTREEKVFSPIEIAVIAATHFIRKLTGRTSTIAAYETQVPAETSKGVEAQVLSGQDPSVLVGTQRTSGVKKEWVTMGDEKVRTGHIVADGQVVDLNHNYIVSGEQLMWPADSSHGASLGNIINCRCASVTDKNTVYSERRESAELLESIQESL